MNCPICGSHLPCIHAPRSAAVLTDDSQILSAALCEAESDSGQNEHGGNWRSEVASRVQQHRFRRGRPDAAQAMELEFAADEALTVTDGPVIRSVNRRSLEGHEQPEPARTVITEGGRVIRFPRMLASLRELEEQEMRPDPAASSAIAPEPTISLPHMDFREQPSAEVTRSDEIAQPGKPEPARAPEQMELLPSFEDIQLEPAYTSSTDAGAEIIPRPAPLQQRLMAGLVDIGLVALAALLFAYAFVRMSEDVPHSRLALLFALCVGGILWIVFQYLFLVYGKGTPGMIFAQLELRTFEGSLVSAKLRRIRAAASAISALSIGLGYGWTLVDEDQLAWHDRMTRTLLRNGTQQPGSGEAWEWNSP